MKQAGKRTAVVLAAAACLALQPAFAQRVTALPQLDLNRMTGTWYQIVRLPDKAEKHCTSNGIVLYALDSNPKRLQVVSSCQTKDGSPEIRNSIGRRADKKTNDGRLKLGFLFPFTSKYWVLAEDPANTWLLVANPNRKSLWILSRNSAMAPDVLTQIEAQATAQGFNSAKFLAVVQTR